MVEAQESRQRETATIMARCRITNPRTLRRLSKRAGFKVVDALTRGNTDHRFDLVAEDGSRWNLYSDGELERDTWLESQNANA